MTDLSPAAQAVLSAVMEFSGPAFEPPSDALYARSCCEFVGERCRADLLAIAAELEGAGA
jgi:hypothetical protein